MLNVLKLSRRGNLEEDSIPKVLSIKKLINLKKTNLMKVNSSEIDYNYKNTIRTIHKTEQF